jgi:hypothetical protein
MSRAYRLVVSESVRRHVIVSDGVQTGIDIPEVLPCEATRALLAQELERRGYTIAEGRAHHSLDGVEIVIDLADGSVTVTASASSEIESTVEGVGVIYDEHLGTSREREARAKLSEKALKEAEAVARSKEETARRANTVHLEAKLNDLQKELDDIATHVTGEALKVRAAQLGEIEELNEDPNTGALTIRVRT